MKNWVLALLAVAVFIGCASAPKSEGYAKDMASSCEKNLAKLTKNDEKLQEKLDKAAGYAMFPLVVKGGAWLGYGYGEGAVFEGGKLVAYTTVNDFSIAFQAGGHGFSMLIVFDEKKDLEDFMAGNFEFSAGADAVFFPWGVGVMTRVAGSSTYFYSRGGLAYCADASGMVFSVAKDE